MTAHRSHARRALPLAFGALCLALLASGCVHGRRSGPVDCDETVHTAYHVVSAVAHLCAALGGD